MTVDQRKERRLAWLCVAAFATAFLLLFLNPIIEWCLGGSP